MPLAPQSAPFASLKPLAPEKPALSHDELREVIDLTLWTAQLLLRSGAQSSRVERTSHLLGTALGADWLDVVVMQEGLVLTTSSGEEFRTRARRVTSVGVNLSLLFGISQMTGEVWAGRLDGPGVRRRLEELDRTPIGYSPLGVVLMVGLACGAFCRLFGGDWTSFAVTWSAASLAMVCRQQLAHRYFNPLLIVIAAALTAGLVPCMAHRAGLLRSPEEALAASVLLLVPGVPLINAARDVLRGYLVAGIARGFHGLIISLCISLGLGIALSMCSLEFHPAVAPLAENFWSHVASDALWSGVAAIGFAVLFNVPRWTLPICFGVGAVGHALRTIAQASHVSIVPGTLLAAVTVGLLAEVFARRYRAPAGIVAVPAAIPMVPGVFAFRSMSALLNLTSPRFTSDQFPLLLMDAVRNFTLTGLILASLAVGIALPSLMLKRQRPVV